MSQRSVVADEWRRIVREQQSSGMSVTAFCRRHRVPQSSFFAWRRKVEGVATFAEVKLSPEPAREATGIELRLSSGRCLLVRPGFDRQTLIELLHILGERACESANREAGV